MAKSRKSGPQSNGAPRRRAATVPTAGRNRLLVVGGPPPEPAAEPAPDDGTILRRKERPRCRLRIEVVHGDILAERTPVAVIGQYKSMAPTGVVRRFDKALHDWITGATELGMVGSDLGELFYIPVGRLKVLGAQGLVLAGMGEPGQFTRDDLAFLMTNITFAIRALGHESFATLLIGAGVGGLPMERAARGLLEGVVDGLTRYPGDERASLRLRLVEYQEDRADKLVALLKKLGNAEGLDSITLSVERRRGKFPTAPAEGDDELQPSADHQPIESGPRITVEADAGPTADRTVFRYSALATTAVIPLRDVEVQTYFARLLPTKLVNANDRHQQEKFGRLLEAYLIPEDFRRLLEGDGPLTVVVDPTTALFPWEMAGYRGYRGTHYFGPDLRLTRQFRTLRSASPGIAPPLNHGLKVLIIADPAHGPYRLPGARLEGLAVVEILDRVKRLRGGDIDMKVVARIGSVRERDDPGLREVLERVRSCQHVQVDADVCDPIDVLSLILNEEFDVVHYAGHGVFENDPPPGRKGWVFDWPDCILSAREIFRVRQVPRLVFANACHSAEVDGAGPAVGVVTRQQVEQQVGMAEAFFARGIQNYIGTGWEVDDALAREFARRFYAWALGVRFTGHGPETFDTAPPGTLGDALAEARRAILHQGTTWGAYQHYGQATGKLIDFRNRPDDD